MNLPDPERLMASAVHYLLQGNEHDVATILLMCDVDVSEGDFGGTKVLLTGPRAAYEVLSDTNGAIGHAVHDAFLAVHPSFAYYSVRAQFLDTLDANWRTELLEIAAGRGIHNQAVDIPKREVVMWRGTLRFRSQSEVQIAAALDFVGVLFLPNCLARLGVKDNRVTREADFLVCHEGKWGVLEVDGPFHPRAADDHARDRLFQQHGIRVTQRFTAEECYRDALGVVRRFLALLQKNG